MQQALPGLIGLAREDRPLLFVDYGAQDASREMIQAFIRRHGGIFAALEGPLSAANVTAFAHQQTGADYVLNLTPQDRINHAGLATLEQRLRETAPERVLMVSSFWATSVNHPIPGPDVGRDPGVPRALFADPRRLLLRGRACNHPDPLTDPANAWALWESELADPGRLLMHPDPVLLPPLPEAGAAPSFTAAANSLKIVPRATRTARFDKMLLRLNDALALAPASAAPATVAAANHLWATLPRALRRGLRARTGPATSLLTALARNDQAAAMAQLALLAQTRADLSARALAAEYAALRHDLELALPGPEYLRDLYARLRGV